MHDVINQWSSCFWIWSVEISVKSSLFWMSSSKIYFIYCICVNKCLLLPDCYNFDGLGFWVEMWCISLHWIITDLKFSSKATSTVLNHVFDCTGVSDWSTYHFDPAVLHLQKKPCLYITRKKSLSFYQSCFLTEKMGITGDSFY